MPQHHRHDMTKERILNEAEALFAQKGFHAVSVREITKRARCNLAAVNYHFGNKQNLYLEVFRSRWVARAMRIRKFFEKSLAAHDAPSPTAVIQALAQAFLEGPLSDDERWRHHQLISRELAQPTQAFDVIASQVMQPFFKQLAGRLRPFMPEGTDEERLILNILSIFAMVLYFNFARAAITRITGHEYDQAYKARLIRHIIAFSLNGLGVEEKEGGG
jgi:AcrR family transcriptional regulator